MNETKPTGGEQLAQIQALHSGGDIRAATTLALKCYGPEIFGWLLAITHDEEEAAEIFSQASEDLWSGFPSFRWECSLRTWLDVLARNAHRRHLLDPFRHRARSLSRVPPAHLQANGGRTRTRPEHRTETRRAFARLRQRLDTQDQSLLILRVDRELAWNDIAVIMTAQDQELGPSRRRRQAARLRKRFERIKTRLRQWALQEGLLEARP